MNTKLKNWAKSFLIVISIFVGLVLLWKGMTSLNETQMQIAVVLFLIIIATFMVHNLAYNEDDHFYDDEDEDE